MDRVTNDIDSIMVNINLNMCILEESNRVSSVVLIESSLAVT